MRKALALPICALAFVAGAYAQATAGLGSVSGTVRDASGAVIPNATVVVANEGKGIKRTMNSTEAGVFAARAANACCIAGLGRKLALIRSTLSERLRFAA